MLKKIILGLGALIVLLIVGLLVTIQVRSTRTFDTPEPALKASTDPELIARGEQLIYGTAACATCHVPREQHGEIGKGTRVPLIGGAVFEIPPGTFYSTNLTPDPTGIGNMTDGQLARMIRHNIRADGQVAIPFMEYPDMADDDVVALMSYLRSLEPVKNAVPARELTFLGKAVMAFALGPNVAEGPVPKRAPASEPTVERGRYLAESISHCKGCHTARDLRDGSYIGPAFAGGMHMEIEGQPGKVYVTPNITPDEKTGVMSDWSEDDFVDRFQDPSTPEGSHMPWVAYSQMPEDDLRAIYRFIQQLEPVENDTGDLIQSAPEG